MFSELFTYKTYCKAERQHMFLWDGKYFIITIQNYDKMKLTFELNFHYFLKSPLGNCSDTTNLQQFNFALHKYILIQQFLKRKKICLAF